MGEAKQREIAVRKAVVEALGLQTTDCYGARLLAVRRLSSLTVG